MINVKPFECVIGQANSDFAEATRTVPKLAGLPL